MMYNYFNDNNCKTIIFFIQTLPTNKDLLQSRGRVRNLGVPDL